MVVFVHGVEQSTRHDSLNHLAGERSTSEVEKRTEKRRSVRLKKKRIMGEVRKGIIT
jgi:hypothetical protein